MTSLTSPRQDADAGRRTATAASHRLRIWAGKAFVVAAFVEAATWAGLLVGMFLKYVTRTTELGVTYFGSLHGVAFLAYVAITIVAAILLKWRWWTVLLLFAAVPPLMTVVAEIWIRRTGRLDPLRPHPSINRKRREQIS